MSRPLVLTWRRALPLVIGTAAAIPLTYVGRWRDWMSIWSETQHLVGVGFVLMFPFAAGLGAWAGAAHQRQGLDELGRLSARSQWAVSFREHAELVSWAVLGYVLGALPAYVATAMTAVNGRPAVLPALSQAWCVAGVVTLGWAVGCRFPSRLAAPVVAAGTYAIFAFLAIYADEIVLALTPFEERWMTFHRILWWVMALQCLGWCLVVVQGVARRAKRPNAALSAVMAVGLVCAPLLLVTPGTRVAADRELRVRCASFGPGTLCLPHAKESLRSDLAVELDRGATLLSGLVPPRATFLDDEAAETSAFGDKQLAAVENRARASGNDVVQFSTFTDLSTYARVNHAQIHSGLIMHFVQHAPYDPKAPVQRGRPEVTPTELVWRWYFEATGLPLDGTAYAGGPMLDDGFLDYRHHEGALRWLASLEPEPRAQWFRAHASAMRTGELAWSDFGDRNEG